MSNLGTVIDAALNYQHRVEGNTENMQALRIFRKVARTSRQWNALTVCRWENHHRFYTAVPELITLLKAEITHE